jgi:acetyl esterase/lipase
MPRSWHRRAFLGASAAGLAAGVVPSRATAAEEPAKPQTFVYKTVGDCPIKADVYGAAPGENRPLAVWVHGGALIMGDRRGIDRALLAELLKSGYVVISIDYRLAPETKLPAIHDDLRDALAWASAEGPRRFGARDDRLAVLGGSAGGYLTLVSGYLIKLRPSALVAFWGYGDISSAWYGKPDPFYRRQPLVTETDARAAVGQKIIAEPPPKNDRGRFYLYCRQNGLWSREVAGIAADAGNDFDRFCPIRNLSAEYPPTFLVHGTHDSDVPHEQSVVMDRELSRFNVPHEFVSIPGMGHGLRGVDTTIVADLYRRVLAFLRKYAG